GSVRMSLRRITPGTLDHSSYCCCFSQRNIFQCFTEINSCGFCHTAHPNTASLAQVDLIAVKSKDVLLRQTVLQRQRYQRFVVLSTQSLFRTQVGILNQLLSDRGSALRVSS